MLREGFSGSGWSFFTSAGVAVAWSLPCGGFWGTAREANGNSRATRVLQPDKTVLLRGSMASPPEQQHRVGLLQRGCQKQEEGPARNSALTAKKQAQLYTGLVGTQACA